MTWFLTTFPAPKLRSLGLGTDSHTHYLDYYTDTYMYMKYENCQSYNL